jgi:hypothetical protein
MQVLPPGTTIPVDLCEKVIKIVIDSDGFPSVTLLSDLWDEPFDSWKRSIAFSTFGKTLRDLLQLYGAVKFDSFYTEDECKSILKEEYDLLAKIPRPEEVRMTYSRLSNGKIKDDDWEGFYKFITGDLTKEEAKNLHDLEEPEKDFGAPTTTGTIFQMHSLWNARAKAMNLAYSFFPMEILPTLDRVSRLVQPSTSKKPALVHWDGDPRKIDNSINDLPGLLFLSDVLPGMQGLALVPGSNTPEFFAKLRKDYKYLFPSKSVPIRSMTSLDPEKPDPLNLMKRKQDDGMLAQITGKQGTLVFFSEAVIHAVLNRVPDGVNRVRHAAYIGIIKKENDDLEDRQHSYETGEAPKRFPSGSLVHYHQPKKFLNYPKLAESFQNKFRPAEWRGTRKLDKPRKGEKECATVASLVPLPPSVFDYKPAPLTPFMETLVPLKKRKIE